MILSSDELEIVDYLKSYNGNFVSLVEICRCAGGRRKYDATPHWARRLMSRLVEGQILEVNDRGHYRAVVETAPVPKPVQAGSSEDYFPAKPSGMIVGDDYFPGPEGAAPAAAAKTKRWYSPQMEKLLKKSAKKHAKH